MSVEGVRKLTQEQKRTIDQTWKNIKPLMKTKGDQYSGFLFWSNMYLNGKIKVDFENKEQWLELIQKINHQIFPNTHILVSGFVLNPANSTKTQHWHNDYGTKVNTIFIPLVDQGCQTATQIITYPLKKPGNKSDLGYESHFGFDVLDIMDREGLDFMPVTQMVCRSHTIIKMSPGSVHRGIANRSNTQRVLFYIHSCSQKIQLNQQQFVQSNLVPRNQKF